MQEVEINKIVITAINVIILMGLPVWAVWHGRRIKNCEHMSYDYWMQILIVMCYITAICAEIPALWARWKAYYIYHMDISDSLYVLTTWDRWNHLLFYVIFMFLTWSITYKRVPKAFTEALG